MKTPLNASDAHWKAHCRLPISVNWTFFR